MYLAPNGNERAFLWNGQVVDLGLPPGATRAYGAAINNKTQVTGFSQGGGSRSFIWESGTITTLNVPLTPHSGNGIGEDGRIVGHMGGSSVNSVAYLWQGGQTTNLGAVPGGYTATATAIAPNGTIGGYGYVTGGDFGYRRAFVLREYMTNMGVLSGYTESLALDTNNWVTVGLCSAWPAPVQDVAFQFANGTLQRLDSLQSNQSLWLSTGRAISHNGSVVAVGVLDSTNVRVVLRPVFGPPGDADGSCSVNVTDLLLVIRDWGKTNSSGDVNNDGIVNVADLLVVIQNWTGN